MKKDYPISVGEKQYLLRYNFDALTTIEDLSGHSFFQVLGLLQSGSLKHIKTVLYAGLRKNHPEIEIDAVGGLIDDAEDLKTLIENVMAAVNNYFEKNKGDAKKKKKPDAVASPQATEE